MSNVLVNESSLQAIANAIRSKGQSGTFLPSEMAAAIGNIQGLTSATFSQTNTISEDFITDFQYTNDYSYTKLTEYLAKTTDSEGATINYPRNEPFGYSVNVSAGKITVIDLSNMRKYEETVTAGTYNIYNITPTSKGGLFINTNANGDIVKAGRLLPTGDLRMIKVPYHEPTIAAGYGRNKRDLGGWACDGGTVKYGMLFRGGELTDTDRGVMVDFLGIKNDIDLRGNTQISVSPLGADVNLYSYTSYAWYALFQPDTTTPLQIWKQTLRDLFDCVARGEPTYFHCASGLDRTGTFAFVILALLGVPFYNIDKDYELSWTSDRTRNRDSTQTNGQYKALVDEANTVRGNTLRDRIVNFVADCGFTAAEINAFRHAMIDGNPQDVTPDVTTYTVTNTLTHTTTDNLSTSCVNHQRYVANITPNDGYVIDSVQVKVGGTDVTDAVWNGNEATIKRNIKYNLSNCTAENNKTFVLDGTMFFDTITPNTGYTLTGATVSIKMGGIEVSTTYYKNGKIEIPDVTGNVVITVSAVSAINNVLDDVGYENGKRLSGSSGNTEALSGACTTGFIPFGTGDVIRLKGFEFVGYPSACVVAYDSEKARGGSVGAFSAPYNLTVNHLGNVDVDSNNVMTITANSATESTVKYIRISGMCSDGANAFATVNQPLPTD